MSIAVRTRGSRRSQTITSVAGETVTPISIPNRREKMTANVSGGDPDRAETDAEDQSQEQRCDRDCADDERAGADPRGQATCLDARESAPAAILATTPPEA